MRVRYRTVWEDRGRWGTAVVMGWAHSEVEIAYSNKDHFVTWDLCGEEIHKMGIDEYNRRFVDES